MPSEHDLLGLVGKIYESSFDPSQWSRRNRRNGNQSGNQATDSRPVS